MSIHLEHDGLVVDLAAHHATATVHFDALSDLPDLGTAAAWVALDGVNLGANWYVDDIRLQLGSTRRARLSARQPGYDWTWLGLAPIEVRGSYDLIPSVKVVDGAIELGYWPVFSNWDDADNWGADEPNPLQTSLKTWEIEFVSATARHDWLNHNNGTWPAGFAPPAGTGSGIYRCMRMAIEVEPSIDFKTGSAMACYRHFAVFREAPSLGATQLEWVGDTWSGSR